MILAGIFCLRDPALSLITLVVLVALGWLVDGVMNLVIGIQNPTGERLWKIVMGIAFLLGAIVLLFNPALGLLTFVLLGGWILIAFGIVTLIAGIMGLRAAKQITAG
jgi:uncharacterized membrane protein HdeD (DUF308 family)